MRDIGKRIERLKAMLDDEMCICHKAAHQVAIVREGSSSDETAMAFTCPVHGHRLPAVILRFASWEGR